MLIGEIMKQSALALCALISTRARLAQVAWDGECCNVGRPVMRGGAHLRGGGWGCLTGYRHQLFHFRQDGVVAAGSAHQSLVNK